jgi:hypothetical protein
VLHHGDCAYCIPLTYGKKLSIKVRLEIADVASGNVHKYGAGFSCKSCLLLGSSFGFIWSA